MGTIMCSVGVQFGNAVVHGLPMSTEHAGRSIESSPHLNVATGVYLEKYWVDKPKYWGKGG